MKNKPLKRPPEHDQIITWAAINNAVWCDIVCQSQNITGFFAKQMWYSFSDTPIYYPNVVTLKANCNPILVESIAEKIQGKFSIKDSFNILQLPESKYDKLFTGKWFMAKPIKGLYLPYHIINTIRNLKDWEEAIDDDLTTSGFNHKVLSHPAVRIIAVKMEGKVKGGCILTRSREVVGLTNFFYPADQMRHYWSTFLRAASIFAGNVPVVGYMRSDLLNEITPADTTELGGLSVWVRKPLTIQISG